MQEDVTWSPHGTATFSAVTVRPLSLSASEQSAFAAARRRPTSSARRAAAVISAAACAIVVVVAVSNLSTTDSQNQRYGAQSAASVYHGRHIVLSQVVNHQVSSLKLLYPISVLHG
jgi:hypothetical protein